MAEEILDMTCNKCGHEWSGKPDCNGHYVWRCPKCGAGPKYIQENDYHRDYDNQILGGGKFNWNKK